MQVRIDISRLAAERERFERHMVGLGERVFRVCKVAAAEERVTSSYQNRTGRLRTGTKAVRTVLGRDGWVVVLKMGMFYGVFVQNRGYSDFTAIGDDVVRQVNALMGGAIG